MAFHIVPPLSPGDPVDAEVLRRTCDAVLRGPTQVSEENREGVINLLYGCIGLLLPVVEEQRPAMGGEWEGAAEHAVDRAQLALLSEGTAARTADHMENLAVLCRSLLTLHQRAVPRPVEA